MTTFPTLAREELLARLAPPSGPVSMVLDTDTYNEIDDQFALVYALLSPGLTVEAVYAAPFLSERSADPGVGMAESYEEILRILARLGRSPEGLVHRGSTRFLPAEREPVPSPAAEDLIRKALRPRAAPLYVVAIGAITNVASAILLEPEIVRRIVVVWLGGEPYYWRWPMSQAFNLYQDVPAARVVFDSGVPLVHVPCSNVSEHLRSTLPEIEAYVRGRGAIGDFLYERFRAHYPDHFARSKVIWDIAGIAYLVDPRWTPGELRPSPILRDDLTWGPVDESRHCVREILGVSRDDVFADLFRKLDRHSEGLGAQPHP